MNSIQSVAANRTWDNLVKHTDDILIPAKGTLKAVSYVAKTVGSEAVLAGAKGALQAVKFFSALRTLAEVIPRQKDLNFASCHDAVTKNKDVLIADVKELKRALDDFQKTPLAKSSKDLAQFAFHASACLSATGGAIETLPSIFGAIAEGTIALGAFAKAGEAKANFFEDLPALLKDSGPSMKSLERLVDAMSKLAVDVTPVLLQCTPDFKANPSR